MDVHIFLFHTIYLYVSICSIVLIKLVSINIRCIGISDFMWVIGVSYRLNIYFQMHIFFVYVVFYEIWSVECIYLFILALKNRIYSMCMRSNDIMRLNTNFNIDRRTILYAKNCGLFHRGLNCIETTHDKIWNRCEYILEYFVSTQIYSMYEKKSCNRI